MEQLYYDPNDIVWKEGFFLELQATNVRTYDQQRIIKWKNGGYFADLGDITYNIHSPHIATTRYFPNKTGEPSELAMFAMANLLFVKDGEVKTYAKLSLHQLNIDFTDKDFYKYGGRKELGYRDDKGKVISGNITVPVRINGDDYASIRMLTPTFKMDGHYIEDFWVRHPERGINLKYELEKAGADLFLAMHGVRQQRTAPPRVLYNGRVIHGSCTNCTNCVRLETETPSIVDMKEYNFRVQPNLYCLKKDKLVCVEAAELWNEELATDSEYVWIAKEDGSGYYFRKGPGKVFLGGRVYNYYSDLCHSIGRSELCENFSTQSFKTRYYKGCSPSNILFKNAAGKYVSDAKKASLVGFQNGLLILWANAQDSETILKHLDNTLVMPLPSREIIINKEEVEEDLYREYRELLDKSIVDNSSTAKDSEELLYKVMDDLSLCVDKEYIPRLFMDLENIFESSHYLAIRDPKIYDAALEQTMIKAELLFSSVLANVAYSDEIWVKQDNVAEEDD